MGETRFFERLYGSLKAGEITRREFTQRALGAGLSAATVAFVVNALDFEKGFAQATPEASPSASLEATAEELVGVRPEFGTENQTRGEGGNLNLLLWQVPTVLNQHVSTGGKDTTSSGLYMEPLLNFTPESTLVTRLAAEVPSVSNGGIAPDFSSVTYKLKEGVLWSDGEPFTAADVRFTYEWVSNPENAATTFENYSNVASVDVIDDLTVTVNFTTPTLAWYIPFVGTNGGSILPGHVWGFDATDTGPNTDFRTAPVGTGPFKVTSFSEGVELVVEANEYYREPNKPYFSSVSVTGGAGTSEGAARAVLQTGEADWAWNIQVAPDVIADMANGGTGQMITFAGVATEAIYINFTDPNTEASTGERSSLEIPHPSLTDLAVQQAMSYAIDRNLIADEFYGNGQPGAWRYLVGIPLYENDHYPYSYDPAMANQILDEAGWVLDGNVRSKDGVELSYVYHTTINALRQDTQAVVQANLAEVGIEVELKSTDSTIFFDSGVGNDLNYPHFYSDVEMYTTNPTSPFPTDYLQIFYAGPENRNIAQQSNDWSGQNITRYANPDYDAAIEAALSTTDPEVATAAIIRCSDILTDDAAVIPLVNRGGGGAAALTLMAENIAPGPWEGDFWNIANWRRV